jgi:hypothetical protein
MRKRRTLLTVNFFMTSDFLAAS